jgi:hypothetical protein
MLESVDGRRGEGIEFHILGVTAKAVLHNVRLDMVAEKLVTAI